jgi:hypothetical protein
LNRGYQFQQGHWVIMSVEGYIVCRMVIGSPPRVDSSEAEFKACVAAVDGLQDICDVEEKYENVIENYIEWERDINEHGLRQMVSFEISYNGYADSRKLIARKLLNLLASVRLYLDSLPKHSKRILAGNEAGLASIRQAPSTQYDSRLSYRVMEALRNYSQHAALPIHGVRTRATRHDIQDSGLLFQVLPTIDRDQLAQDGLFKRSVLEEINQPEAIELKSMVREYIEGVSAIHTVFRSTTDQQQQEWIGQINAPTARFKEQFPDESTLGLAVLPVDEEGFKAAEEVYVAGPLEGYLTHLQQKYTAMIGFAKRKVDF